jgi:hypothetical protein
VAETHWVAWHRPYDDPTSALYRRLTAVRTRIVEALDRPPGPVAVISMCAGQGRDLIGALSGHPRAADVSARLVEADPANAATADVAARAAGLDGVVTAVGDAGLAVAYDGAVPADIVLVCGVFGNIAERDIAGTIRCLPTLCAPGATVIWTRHRRPPDLTPRIVGWFLDAGFREVGVDAPDGDWFSVGAHQLVGPPRPFDPGQHLFTFTGDGTLPA